MSSKKSIIVIFGATGDLMRKKGIPGLYQLELDSNLSKDSRVIGFSRRDYSKEEFETHIRGVLEKAEMNVEIPEFKSFLDKNDFISSYFDDKAGYEKLNSKLEELVDENSQVIFHLSVAPEFYESIIQNIKPIRINLLNLINEQDIKIVVEKPIGHDVTSAENLNQILSSQFKEEQIYRVDHYLQKDMTREILDFRKNNLIFQNSWDNQSISKIEIVMNEAIGVEERGSFYDPIGAIDDFVQNHILQLLANITCEIPGKHEDFEPQSLRSKILEKLQEFNNDTNPSDIYLGQYEGYKNIEGVEPDSNTETFVHINMEIDNLRWKNVPISLQTGKKMEKDRNEILIHFYDGSKIVFRFEPTTEIVYKTADNRELILKTLESKEGYMDEYSKVFSEVIEGDKSWFVSNEEVLASWRFIDSVKRFIVEKNIPVESYPQNTSPKGNTKAIPASKEIGVIGLGKMGNNLARNLLKQGYKVVVHNRSKDKVDNFVGEGGEAAYEPKDFLTKLKSPRRILLSLPEGEAIESTLFGAEGLMYILEPGDIVIDGGNSKFRESIRRYTELKSKGIEFLDAGISGGPMGALNGACVMIGGERNVFKSNEQIFKDLCIPGGYEFFGKPGSGHFVKMVHNGIEYGMMQAIAEGFGLMKDSEFDLNLKGVTEVYNRGSVVESRLMKWLNMAFEEYGTELREVSGEVGQLGEGRWTVDEAKMRNFVIKVIEESVNFRDQSKGNPSYVGQILSALRNEFGGHEVN